MKQTNEQDQQSEIFDATGRHRSQIKNGSGVHGLGVMEDAFVFLPSALGLFDSCCCCHIHRAWRTTNEIDVDTHRHKKICFVGALGREHIRICLFDVLIYWFDVCIL